MIIYKLTFPNGKIYIGQTNKAKLKYRTNQGLGYLRGNNGKLAKTPVALAIVRYGWENVKQEILETTDNQNKADELERKYIDFFKTSNEKYGYNLAKGGKKNYNFNEKYKSDRKGVHYSPTTEFKKGREATNKKKVLCIETNIIYDSITQCAISMGFNEKHNHIGDVCLGKRKKTNGFHFKYVE